MELVVLPDPPPTSYEPAPPRLIHPGWMYCRLWNDSNEPVLVYGARHESEPTTIPTSLFVLPPGGNTPRAWDCKGLLIPMGRRALISGSVVLGPVALKYRDFRRPHVRMVDGAYQCPRPNGLLGSEQVDFPVPLVGIEALLAYPRRLVAVR